MAEEQKPAGPEAPAPKGGAGAKPPAAPAAKAAAAGHAAPPKAPATMASTPWDGELARDLKGRFGEGILETSTYLGQNFIVTKPDAAIPALEYLKLEADFDYLVDVTAVDWPKRPERPVSVERQLRPTEAEPQASLRVFARRPSVLL